MLNAKYESHMGESNNTLPAFVGCHFIVNYLALSKITVKRKSTSILVYHSYGKKPSEWKICLVSWSKGIFRVQYKFSNQQHYLPSPQEIQFLAIFKLKITVLIRHLQWTNMEQANKQNTK